MPKALVAAVLLLTTIASGALPASAMTDTEVPVLSVVAPVDGAMLQSPLVITGSVTDNEAVDIVEVVVRQKGSGLYLQSDGSLGTAFGYLPQSVDSPGSTSSNFTWTAPGVLPEARYYFVARSRDAAGNLSTSAFSNFEVIGSDVTPPGIVVASPAPGALISDSLVITGTASDDVAATSVEVLVRLKGTSSYLQADGSLGSTPVYVSQAVDTPGATSSPFTWTAPGELAVGRYYFIARALDAQGNVSGLSIQNFEIIDGPSWPSGVVTSSNEQESQLDLAWSGATDDGTVEEYQVFQDGSLVATVVAPATTYTVTGLSPATEYTFTVQAIDNDGLASTDGPSITLTTPDNTAPSFAGGTVSAVLSQNDTVADLTWTAASDNAAVASYEIFQEGSSIGTVAGNVLAFQVTGLTAGESYEFSVEASDAAGNVSTDGPSVTVGAPFWVNGDIQVVALNANSVNITWSGATPNNGPIAQYEFFVNGTFFGSIGAAAPSYLITGLDDGQQYVITVQARDGAPTFDVSTDGPSETIITTDVTDPLWVAGAVSTANVTSSTVDLAWSGATDNGTIVEYRILDGASVVATTDGSTTATTVTGLTDSLQYNLAVEAVDVDGNVSSNGPVAVFTTGDATAPVWTTPTFTADFLGPDNIVLSWTGASDNIEIVNYEISSAGQVVATVPGTATSGTVSGLIDATEYTFTIEAVDAFNNKSSNGPSVTATTTDATAPQWTNETLTTSNVTETAVTLTWSGADDNNGVMLYRVFVDNVEEPVTVPAGTTTYTVTGLTEATSYIFRVEADDLANLTSNDGPSVTQITVDSTAPAWNGDPVTVLNNTGTSLDLLWSAATDNFAVASYSIRQDGVEVGTVPAGTTTFNVTGLTDITSYTFSIEALDSTGNTSTDGPSVTVTTADATAPTWTGGFIGTGLVASTEITFNWSGDSDNVGVVSYVIYGNDVQVGTGTGSPTTVTGLTPQTSYIFRVEAVDAVGNESTGGPQVFVQTPNALIPPEFGPSATVTASNATETTIDLAWTAASDEGSIDYQILVDGTIVQTVDALTLSTTVTGLTAGQTYTFSVQAIDGDNLVSTDGPSTTATVADGTAPIWTGGALNISNDIGTSLDISWLGATDNVGVVSYNVYKDGVLETNVAIPTTFATISGLTVADTFGLSVQAVDAAGNESTTGPTAFRAGPGVPYWPNGDLQASNITSSSFSVAWSGATDDGTITQYRITVDGGSPIILGGGSTSFPIMGLNDGQTYLIEVQATDNDGNTSQDGPTLSVTTVDTTDPTWVNGVITPSNVADVSVDLAWTGATDNGTIASYSVFQDGALIGTVTDPNISVTGLTNSVTYEFVVEANDLDGNVSTDGPSVFVTTVDTTVPTWSAGSATASSVGSDTADLSWSGASDNTDVVAYQVIRNGVVEQTVNAPTTSATVTGLTDATEYTYTIQALDAAGNPSIDGPSVTFTTGDVTAPVWTNPALVTSNITETSVDLAWSGASDNTAVVSYIILQDGVIIDTVPAATTTYSVTGLTSASSYLFAIQALDAASLQSADGPSETILTVDLNAPTWPGGNVNANNVTGTTVELVWTAAVDDFGVETYRIFDGAIELGTVAAPATTFPVAGLTDNTSYTFTVEAVDFAGNESVTGPSVTFVTEDATAPVYAPGFLAAQNITSTTATFSWSGYTDNVGVIGYNIYANDVLLETTALTSITTLSLLPETAYVIRVEAFDAVGNESVGGPTTAFTTPVDTTNPFWSGETLTGSNAGPFSFDVAWTGASDNLAITEYQVLLDGTLVATVPVATTSYSFAGLANGTTYAVTIQAVDAAGNVSTDGPTEDVSTLADGEAPMWPTASLTADNFQGTSLDLTWTVATDNIGVASYEVFQDGASLGTFAFGTNTLAVTGLNPGQSYDFVVQATDGAANTSTDGPSLTITSGGDISAPVWSGSLSSANKTETTVDLSWSVPTDNVAVAGYRITTDDGVELMVINDGSTSGVTLTGLEQNRLYKFTIEAFDAAANESMNGPSTTLTTEEQAAPYWRPADQIFTTDATKIVIIGDSISEGQCNVDIQPWRDDLYDMLTGAGYAVDFVGSRDTDRTGFNYCLSPSSDRDHESRSGADTQEFLDGFGGLPGPWATRINSFETADTAVIWLGINDKLNGAFGRPVGAQRSNVDIITNLNLIIDELENSNPNVEIVIATIMAPPSFENSSNVRHPVLFAEINDLNIDINALAIARGASIVDMSSFSVAESPDEIHLNAAGAAEAAIRTDAVLTANTTLAQNNDGVTDTTVSLDWSGARDDVAVTGYKVFQDGTEIADVATTSFQVTGLTADTSYTFGVSAYDADTNETAGPSVFVTTTGDQTAPTWTAGSLSAGNATETTIDLAWSGASDETGLANYNVYVDGSLVAGAVAGPTYQVTGLQPGVEYVFSVEAVDTSGNVSTTGPTATLSTVALPFTPLGQAAELFGSNTSNGDYLGYAVAADGDTAVAGAYREDTKGSNAGAIWVFTSDINGNWTEQQMITAADGAADDEFGKSVAISGDTIVVGSPGNGTGGSVYVYTRTNGVWTQQDKLVGSDTASADLFGEDVAIDGDSLVAGGSLKNGSGANEGAAYVFTRTNGVWVEEQKLVASDGSADDEFGGSVSIHGDNVIVGAEFYDGVTSNHGAAYVFTRSGGVWTEQQILLPSDTPGGDRVGFDVAIEGDTALVGAPQADDPGLASTGAVYLYKRTGATWTEQEILKAPEPAATDRFGHSVDIDGSRYAVGIFELDDPTLDEGGVYLFTETSTGVFELIRFTASEGSFANKVGHSVAVSGELVFAGAWGDDDAGSNHGSVYVFDSTPDLTAPIWTNGSLVESNLLPGSVSLSWSGASDNTAVAQYRVIQDGLIVQTVVGNSTVINGLNSETTYVFSVEAVDGGGNVSTGGPEVTVTTPEGDAIAPTWTNGQITPANETDSTIDFSWSGASDDVGIQNYDVSINGSVVGTVTGTSYTATGLTSDTTYTVSVEARDTSGNISTTGPATSATTAQADVNNEIAKILNGDPTAEDEFGFAVAASVDTVAIGIPKEDEFGSANSGSVRVYVADGNGGWAEQQRLRASDDEANDNFGFSVAIDGDRIVVGANLADEPSNSGAAYVFERTGGVWTETALLKANPTGSSDQFGYDVAVDGDTVVVGEYRDDVGGTNTGSIHVYVLSGGSWTLEQEFQAIDNEAGSLLGLSVAISGDTIIAGAPEERSVVNGTVRDEHGAAYVFTRTNGVWTQEQRLQASDFDEFDEFGFDVAIEGDVAVVGAPLDDDGGTRTGSAYVFKRTGGVWSETAKLNAFDPSEQARFGWSVAIDGVRIAIGAWEGEATGTGVVYSYTEDTPNSYTTLKFEASDGSIDDHIGWSVDIVGDVLFAGAPTGGTANAGAVYVFDSTPDLTAPTWTGGTITTSNLEPASVDLAWSGDSDDTGVQSYRVFQDDVLIGSPTSATFAVSGLTSEGTYLFRIEAVDPAGNTSVDGPVLSVTTPFGDTDGPIWTNGTLTASNASATTVDLAWSGASDVSGVASYVIFANGTEVGTSVGTVSMVTGLSANTAYTFKVEAVDTEGNTSVTGPTVAAATTAPIEINEIAKLVASDAVGNDELGYSVSIDGDTMVVGAHQESETGFTLRGAAYVFVRNPLGAWVEEAKLTASDAGANDFFGRSVAVSGNVIVVGAPNEDLPNNGGAAYVFSRANGIWTEDVKLSPADISADDLFGTAVAIDGNTIVVGAPNWDGNTQTNNGTVYVYTGSAGGAWTLQERINDTTLGSGAHLGAAVAIDGDRIIAGSPDEARLNANDNVQDAQGVISFFTRSGGSWTLEQTVEASDGTANDGLGNAVGIDGDVAVAGALRASFDGNASGSVYEFNLINGTWTEVSRIDASDGAAINEFGYSVDYDNGILAVGSFRGEAAGLLDVGAIYSYERSAPGVWTEKKFVGSDASTNDKLGAGVAVSGTTIAGGAWGQDPIGSNSGAVYVFDPTVTVPIVSITDVTVAEGNTGTVVASATLTLDTVLTEDISLTVATADGTAVAGSDYVATSTSVSFLAGATTATVDVTINGDVVPEGDEVLNLILSNQTQGVALARLKSNITITNDDGAPSTVTASDVSVDEGGAGTTTATLTFTLDAASPVDVTFDYATSDGTALAGEDYTAASGTVTFLAGEQLATVDLTVIGDAASELDEQFNVLLSNASEGLVLGQPQVIVGVTNDDGQLPVLAIADASVTEGDSGAVIVDVTISLLQAADQIVTADFATSDGSATAGEDYLARSGSVSFAVGETIKTESFTVFGDGTVEAGESFTVSLSNVLPAVTQVNQGTAVVTIDNDDFTVATVDLVAGTGSLGYTGDGGQAINATLTRPFGVAYGPNGDVYISDTENNVVRKVDSATGIITTVVGTGSNGYSGDGGLATAAELDKPYGVDFDAAGNMYIPDSQNHAIRMVDAVTGNISTIAGGNIRGFDGDGGQATAARLNAPLRVTVYNGSLFIADHLNHRIREVDLSSGVIDTVAGSGPIIANQENGGFSGDGGLATSARLAKPYGPSFDSAGNMYIADRENHRIRRVDATTGIITTIAGSGPSGTSADGAFTGDGGQATSARLDNPRDVVLDSLDNIYIAGTSSRRIRVIDTAGVITTYAGNGDLAPSGDGGPALSAGIGSVSDIDILPDGRIVFNNDVTSGNVIRELTPAATGATPPTWVAGSLTGSNVASTSVDLAWSGATDNVGVVGYDIFVDGNQVAATSGTSFNLTGLTAGTTYSIVVQAEDSEGTQSIDGPTLSVTTP